MTIYRSHIYPCVYYQYNCSLLGLRLPTRHTIKVLTCVCAAASPTEVYVDEGKKSYRDLGYKRFTWLSIWTALLSRISRAAVTESKRMNISGNLSGDGLQNGGLLIVDKGGSKVLLNHHEETPGDHVANETVLQSLGITEVVPSDK